MSVLPEPSQASEPVPFQAGEPVSDAPAGGQDLLGLRIGAGLIDLALLLVLFVVLAVVVGEAIVNRVGVAFSFYLDGAEAALYFAVVLLYYLVLEAAIGQTVGKLLVGLRVVRAAGGRPSVWAVVTRTVLRVVDWLPLLYLVGFIAMLATGARRRRLGDLAARTDIAGSPDSTPWPRGGRPGLLPLTRAGRVRGLRRLERGDPDLPRQRSVV